MPKPILLVEGNPFDRDLAIVALERANLLDDTVVLNDGVEALDYLLRRGAYADRASGNPSVIVLDLNMPRMDGVEVLEAVRAHADTAQIPVVMLTSSKGASDLDKCYALGANAYVVKPIEFQELVGAISEIGTFWAVLNEPTAGSIKHHLLPDS